MQEADALATVQWLRVDAFVPIHESALTFEQVITATPLTHQSTRLLSIVAQ